MGLYDADGVAAEDADIDLIVAARNAVPLLLHIRDLLAEKVEYGVWSHEHCDEIDGRHRFDGEAWESDAREALEALESIDALPLRGEVA